MAKTVYTKDGKVHTLIGGTTLGSVIRDYAGEDVARSVAQVFDELVWYAEYRAPNMAALIGRIKRAKREYFFKGE